MPKLTKISTHKLQGQNFHFQGQMQHNLPKQPDQVLYPEMLKIAKKLPYNLQG